MIKTLGISLAVATVLSMSGCGGSSSNDNITNNTTVSGKVADGYLDKAKVCLDKNENGKCDTDEPNTLSVDGSYNLNITKTDIGKYPILVEVTTSTIDLDDGNLVTKPYTLTAPKDSIGFISPITTLIKSQIDNNPALTTKEATSIVSSKLNITSDNSKLLTNYVKDESSSTVSKQLHEVGKVLAKLIADIEDNIKNTLGIKTISDAQRAGLSKIVNDIALKNILTISAKIKDDNKTISELTSDISNIVTKNKNKTRNDILSASKQHELTTSGTSKLASSLKKITLYNLETLNENGTMQKGIDVNAMKWENGKKLSNHDHLKIGFTDNVVASLDSNLTANTEYSFTIDNDGAINIKRVRNRGTYKWKITEVNNMSLSNKTYTIQNIINFLDIKLDSGWNNKLTNKITFTSGDIFYETITIFNDGTIQQNNYFNKSAMIKIINKLK